MVEAAWAGRTGGLSGWDLAACASDKRPIGEATVVWDSLRANNELMAGNPAFVQRELPGDPRRWVHRHVAIPALALTGALLCYGVALGSGSPTHPWALTGGVGLASLLCLWRARALRDERLEWTLMGSALACATAGLVYLAVTGSSPGPFSPADIGRLAFYPLAAGAFWHLANGRIAALRNRQLDGLAGFLTVAALSAAVVIDRLLKTSHGATSAVTLVYLLGDMTLLGMVGALLAMAGWPAGRSSRCMVLALACFAGCDLFAHAPGVRGRLGWTDAGLSLAAGLLALASWMRGSHAQRFQCRVARHRLFSVTVCATAIVGMLLYGMPSGVGPLELGLVAAALCCGVVRTFQVFNEAHALTARITEESLTDALTALPNRRQLMVDLERALASIGAPGHEPAALVICDLNGFKSYNDTFGHPAGDMLLRRLARNLAAAVENRASAYRLGGDEFCVLLAADANLSYLLAKATAALSETGEGYHITAAHGVAMLPKDASTVTEAMSIADLRMYAQKSGGRSSVGSQMRDLLLRTLTERSKALGDHNDDVALLAREVAHKLCLSSEEVDEVVRAAELHDVGKLALPDAILFKPGALSDEEWETMRLHTTIGQRILAASPALASVGRLVRSSHERWDGAGYPDQLHGEHIPLGARIVAVCDAFAAMVTDRPYRNAITRAVALAELERCAGTQFDPTVIDAFLAVIADRRSDITWSDSKGTRVSV
jgi:two-component system, cell cycle response regulator